MLKRNEKLIKTKLLQYMLPGIMLTAALQIGNIVDSALVGQVLGDSAMSAVKIGMSIDNIMEIPGYVLGVGGSVAVGILLGKRETEKANKVFSATLVLSLICGFIFSLLSFTSPALANMLTNGNEFTANVNSFVFVTLLCAPILSLALQFISYVAVDNNPAVASAYVITANVINLGLDYVMLKYTPLGTAGAALSTALGYGLAMVVLIAYIKSPKRMLKFTNPFKGFSASLKLALAAGIPTLLYMIFLTVKDLGLNTMIVRLINEDAMTVYTVCSNVVLIAQLLTGGIIGILSSVGSVIYGEKDYFGMKSLCKNVVMYSYIAISLLLVILYLFTGNVVEWFGVHNIALKETAVFSLRIFIVCLPFFVFNKFLTTFYQCTEKSKLSGIVTSLQTCVAILPIAFVLVIAAKALGYNMLTALMISFTLSEIITMLTVTIYRKIKYKGSTILMLPSPQQDNSFDISVNTDSNDVKKLPEEIMNYFKDKGVDSSKANIIAIATEEMTANIIKFGGKKAGTVDINISIAEDKILVRTRDNGVPFDPTSYETDKADFVTGGIEIIKKLTNKITYMRVLDLNNTVIELNI